MARKPRNVSQRNLSTRNGFRSTPIFEPLETRQLMSAGPGTLDPSFGVGGAMLTCIITNDVAVDAGGRSVVVGSRNGDFAVMRFRADGFPDFSFGTGGLVQTDFGGQHGDVAERVVIQPDGKILVAGLAVNALGGAGGSVNANFALARYNND